MAARGLGRILAVCAEMRRSRLESGCARALGLMLFSALGGSLAPVAFHYGGAVESPLIVQRRLSAGRHCWAFGVGGSVVSAAVA